MVKPGAPQQSTQPVLLETTTAAPPQDEPETRVNWTKVYWGLQLRYSLCSLVFIAFMLDLEATRCVNHLEVCECYNCNHPLDVTGRLCLWGFEASNLLLIQPGRRNTKYKTKENRDIPNIKMCSYIVLCIMDIRKADFRESLCKSASLRVQREDAEGCEA